MIGEVERRGCAGRRGVVEAQRIVVGQRVRDRNLKRAGITFLAGDADVAEPHAGRAGGVGYLGAPDDEFEAAFAAVHVVRGRVGRERVGAAIEREASAGDAVGDATYDGTRLRKTLRQATGRRDDLVDHGGEFTGAIRHAQIGQRRAEREDFGGGAVGIREGEALDFDAFGSAAHDGALHRRRGRGGAEEEHGKREGQNARHVFLKKGARQESRGLQRGGGAHAVDESHEPERVRVLERRRQQRRREALITHGPRKPQQRRRAY